MTLLRFRSVLLAKTEVTPGVDPTPDGTNDAIVVEDLQLAWPNELIEPRRLKSTIGRAAPIQGRKYGTLTFNVPIAGSGSAGTAPDWGPLIEACGFGEAIAGGTSVTYTPESPDHESLTIYAYRDGLRYAFTFCRGNVAFSFPAGQRAMMAFTFSGLPVDVVDAALPAVTVDSTAAPVVTGASFTVGGYAGVISELLCDMTNDVQMTDSVNGSDGYGGPVIVDRNAQGSMNPEATLVATHDWWSDWEDGTGQALTLTVGATAGNISTFTAPSVVDRELTETDRAGVLTYDIPISYAESSGNDEVSLVLT